MEPIADLPALQTLLEALAPRSLVLHLSPPGQKRGVYVAHGLYPPEELERVRQAFSSRHAPDDETPITAVECPRRSRRGAGHAPRGQPKSPRFAPKSNSSRETWTLWRTKFAD